VKDPVVLLLDEATSALDSTAEDEVQKALELVSRGRTTLTVAHRQSAIENADVIYVLNNGEIVETGTFHELINSGDAAPIFNKLYNAQPQLTDRTGDPQRLNTM
jgi:ABC-type multidrug transport system fused ATPase/permease subunit